MMLFYIQICGVVQDRKFLRMLIGWKDNCKQAVKVYWKFGE